MVRQLVIVLGTVHLVGLFIQPACAQVRVTPAQAKGGEKDGEPWVEVPESFRTLKIPDWPLPTDLKRWQQVDRPKTRETLLQCLGDMPPRPDPSKVRVLAKEDKGDYILERFEFHNGVDMVVPGILLVPKDRKGPVPVIVGLHGHGSSKESICTDLQSAQLIGPMLVKKGYVVAAIDGYFNGDRVGRGPGGKLDKGAFPQEMSLFTLHLLVGRSLWGMMLRDEQCLIDYL